jgi:cation:H+ antiporter
MLSFSEWPLWPNASIFAAAAVVVWWVGSRLAGYVDGIARQTGLAQGFAGVLLLGGITSLPELATVVTSAWTGNAPLAVNNLLGSASINILLLAIADAVLGRGALTSVIGKPATLLQGTLGMMLLAVVTAVIIVGDVGVLGVGIGSSLLLLMCVAALWLSSGYERRYVWTTTHDGADPFKTASDDEEHHSSDEQPFSGLVVKTAGLGSLILVAGFLLSQTGDAIAQQTGLGTSLVGLVLVGFATSLPELSSIIGAVRIRRYELAVGDIFGTNIFNIALIFVADVAYRGEAVLSSSGSFEAVAALLGLVLTGIFVLGLLERKDETIARMGYDSLAAIAVYAVSLVVLYRLAPM